MTQEEDYIKLYFLQYQQSYVLSRKQVSSFPSRLTTGSVHYSVSCSIRAAHLGFLAFNSLSKHILKHSSAMSENFLSCSTARCLINLSISSGIYKVLFRLPVVVFIFYNKRQSPYIKFGRWRHDGMTLNHNSYMRQDI